MYILCITFQNKNPKYLFLYKTIIFVLLYIHSLCHRHI